MASIKRRRGKYHVVYYYLNEDGEKKQKWESFDTEAEAKHRKAEIEYKQGSRTFIAPSKTTVAAFLEDFVSLYGTKKWSPSTYEANTGLIRNYINPKLGSTLMQDVTSIAADRFISALQRTKCPTYKNRYSKTEYMTPANIERINKLLRCAFGQAVRWDIIAKNPFENTTLPKIKRKPREIWDAATIRKALDECKDGRLYVAINLSFACSLRIGEIVGLTWDNIHISDADIASDNAYLCVEKELVRVREDSRCFGRRRDHQEVPPHNVFGRCQHRDRAENPQNRKQRSQSVDAENSRVHSAGMESVTGQAKRISRQRIS